MHNNMSSIKRFFLVHKNNIFVYTTFFLFFLIVTPVTSSAQLYLIQIGKSSLFQIFLIVNSISMIIVPPLIPFFTSKVNSNLFIAIFVFLAAALLLTGHYLLKNLIIFIFFIPFLIRVFNNVLVPFLAKSTPAQQRSSVFAVRDIFLNLGVSGGFLFLSCSSAKEIFSFSFLVALLLVLALLFLIFLFLAHKQQKDEVDASFLLKNRKEECSSIVLKSLKAVNSKRYLIILLVISVLTSWIGISVSYLPGYIQSEGYLASSVFATYGISYIAVSIFGFLATLIPIKDSKIWYLFDLFFDVLPFSILAFIPGQAAIIGGLILLQMKDFVAPLSLSYFFELFDEKEFETVWGINASVSSAVSLGVPIVVNWVFNISPVYTILISIGTAILSGFIAFLFLPAKKKSVKYMSEKDHILPLH